MTDVLKNEPFVLGDWRVEPTLCRLTRGEETLKLEPQLMKLLMLFASKPGQVLSQTEIETAVWTGVVVTPNSVYQAIAQLRRVLGDQKGEPRYIETIQRKGYRLIAPVSSVSKPPMEQAATHALLAVTAPVNNRRRWSSPVAAATSVVILAAIYSYSSTYSSRRSPETQSASPSQLDRIEQLSLARQQFLEAGEVSAQHAYLLTDLAVFETLQGRDAPARAYLEEAVAMQRQISGNSHPPLAPMLSQLALSYLWNSDLTRAEATAREAVDIFERYTPPLYADRRIGYLALASVLRDTSRFAEAEEQVRRGLALSEQVATELDAWTLDLQGVLVDVLLEQGRLDEAEDSARQLLKNYMQARGITSEVAAHRTVLAKILLDKRRYADSIAENEKAIAVVQEIGSPDHPHGLSARYFIGEALMKEGRNDEAEARFREVVEQLQRTHAEPWRIARAKSGLGAALLAQRRFTEAGAYLNTAIQELQPPGNFSKRNALLQTQDRLRMLQAAQAEVAGQLAHTDR